jgi:hypothetical protein
MGMLALIAGTVSDLHMHLLLGLYGRPGKVAALTPLSAAGMIVAAPAALLVGWRGGCRRDRRRRITESWTSTGAPFGHRPR